MWEFLNCLTLPPDLDKEMTSLSPWKKALVTGWVWAVAISTWSHPWEDNVPFSWVFQVYS